MWLTRNSMVEWSGSTFQRASSASAGIGHAMKSAAIARPMRSACALTMRRRSPPLLFQCGGRFTVAVRHIADRLHVAPVRAGPGPHTDVDVHRFIADVSRDRWKRLGIDHGIDSRLVDFTDA